MKNPYLLVLLYVNGVFCAGTDKVETLEVIEGDSVTLDPCCVVEIQAKDEIEWRFNGAVIAKNGLMYDTDDGKFTHRLSQNPQTGDLTIRNTRMQHTGLYEVKINSSARSVHMQFNVNVRDALPTKVSANEGDAFTFAHDITDIQKYDWIAWMYENGTIAEIKPKSPSPEYYGDNKDRLRMDNRTLSLTIRDLKSTDAGLYRLQVIGQNQNLKTRAYRLTVSTSILSTGIISVTICVLLVMVVIAVILYKKFQKSKAGTGGDGKAVRDPL